MPEAILLKDVEGVGEKGTVVDVSKGYLRNFLIPRKLAQPATQRRRRRRPPQGRRRRARRAATRSPAPRSTPTCSTSTVLTISQQAGDDGRLFGSVTNQDIADAIREARGIRVDKRKVHLEEPIKHVGTYMVVVEVADGVTATIKTMVVEQ